MPTYTNSQPSQQKESKNKTTEIKLDTIPEQVPIEIEHPADIEKVSKLNDINKTSKLEVIPEHESIELGIPQKVKKTRAAKKKKQRETEFKGKNSLAFVTATNSKEKNKRKTTQENTKKPRGKYSAGIA